jgi:cell division protein FtsB
MLDIAGMRLLARRLARLPAQVEQVDNAVASLRQDVGTLRAEVGTLRAEIESLHSRVSSTSMTIDFVAKSTLDALALTNRSLEGLQARLEKLEREPGQHLP